MKNTGIVIIEDDEVLRNAYTTLINDVEGFHVVNSYGSFEDAEKFIVNDSPAVVMLDIELPGASGIEAILWIKKKLPKSYIVMLTVYESEEQIFNALSNGASGYWPGAHSFPRSRMQMEGLGVRLADARRAAVIAPP